MTDSTYNAADQAAGIKHATEVSALRFRTLGKALTTTEKAIAGCSFEAGARYAREQNEEAVKLLDRIVSIADMMLATGSGSLPIDMTPPPMWLSEARELIEKRIRSEA